jgi:hypothetical protein
MLPYHVVTDGTVCRTAVSIAHMWIYTLCTFTPGTTGPPYTHCGFLWLTDWLYGADSLQIYHSHRLLATYTVLTAIHLNPRSSTGTFPTQNHPHPLGAQSRQRELGETGRGGREGGEFQQMNHSYTENVTLWMNRYPRTLDQTVHIRDGALKRKRSKPKV